MVKFLSTPSARRATKITTPNTTVWTISIHALREEGDPDIPTPVCACCDFYPRPPRGGRQNAINKNIIDIIISIHALREEGDQVRRVQAPARRNFYPRPPRGGRPSSAGKSPNTPNFYPRPPRGGRQVRLIDATPLEKISIHALREEGDFAGDRQGRRGRISIHALREEGDTEPHCPATYDNLFLSTPSARRATGPQAMVKRHKANFYPRPPRGGRLLLSVMPMISRDFYPRPPRGGRPADGESHRAVMRFLSTPSARRATPRTTKQPLRPSNFYPRPLRGGRPV